MLTVFRKWYSRIFASEESLLLLLLIVGGLAVIVWLGGVLAPMIASVILAFLLQGLISQLNRRGVPRTVSLLLTYALFSGAFALALLVLLPMFWQQLINLFSETPHMLDELHRSLYALQDRYPQLLTDAQLGHWIDSAGKQLTGVGQLAVSFSLSKLPNLVALLVYLILIPILVFFLLKDKDRILAWLGGFLPAERPLMDQVWREMNRQIANYARGKAIEILLVGVVSWIGFAYLKLNYAALLALLVGLSVVIPYIGATVVTIPVALVAFFQWGWSAEFFGLIVFYGIVQVIDGNILVPLLFSEAVNLHPVAIILAVLVFGGFWGLWGVFFAIPLATLVKALITAWPRAPAADPEQT